MAKSITLDFEFLRKDEVVAHVTCYNDGEVELKLYSDHPYNNPLTRGKSMERVIEFLEWRCFPRTRGNAQELLEYLGLKEYDPIGIVRKTHGVQFDDIHWVRFVGERLCYNDVKIRD